jgi:hypothetical protein
LDVRRAATASAKNPLQKFVHLREDVTPASSDRLILVRVGHFLFYPSELCEMFGLWRFLSHLLPVAPGRVCSLPLTLFIGAHVSAILIHAVVANKQGENFGAVEMIVALAMRSTLHVRAMMQSNDLKKTKS